MAKYDDASWHYEGDYPDDLPQESAATHIGFFVAWCINNDLMSEEQIEDSEDEIQKVKARKMTGAEFLISACDEKFSDYDLSELGQQFANDYYNDDTTFTVKFSSYADDFCDVFNKSAKEKGFEYASIYHVENTWENYDLIKTRIDQRFNEWKPNAGLSYPTD